MMDKLAEDLSRCGNCESADVYETEETILRPYGDSDDPAMITVKTPAVKCRACGFSCYDERCEKATEEAVAKWKVFDDTRNNPCGHRHRDLEAKARCWGCSHPQRFPAPTSEDEAEALRLVEAGFIQLSRKYRRVMRVNTPPFKEAVTFDARVPVWLRKRIEDTYYNSVHNPPSQNHEGVQYRELSENLFEAFQRVAKSKRSW